VNGLRNWEDGDVDTRELWIAMACDADYRSEGAMSPALIIACRLTVAQALEVLK
jgi:hypothetical protein